MIRPSNEPDPTDLAAGYILDDLSPEEAAQLDRALAQEPALHQEIGSLGEAFAAIPYGMPIVEPSARLKDRILSIASQSAATNPEPILSTVVPFVPPRRTWQRWSPAISTGIAAVAVAALGLSQVQLSQQSQQTIALGQQLKATNIELNRLRSELQASQSSIARLSLPDTQTYTLIGAAPDPNNGRIATARLLATPGNVAVTLVTHDMPKLSNNRIYRLWAVAKPFAAPMYCGQFRQNAHGTAQWVAPNAACTQNPSQLLITIDAPTDPTTAAGPLVMQSPI